MLSCHEPVAYPDIHGLVVEQIKMIQAVNDLERDRRAGRRVWHVLPEEGGQVGLVELEVVDLGPQGEELTSDSE